MKQQTIKQPVELSGRGLFTGEPARLRFRPARPHTGIVFTLLGEPQPVRIAARLENVTKRARRTALRNGTAAIETVEHCLSACAGMGIDNLEVELTGREVPSVDGSCAPFVKMIQDAGIDVQDVPREIFVISEVLRVQDGDAELIALPPLPGAEGLLEIHYVLDYGDSSPIGRQSYMFQVTPEIFAEQIAPARTFLLLEEARAFREQGLGTHLTYEDLVIFGPEGPVGNTLRFPNECVRHKILDLIGDLSLFGESVAGRVHARKSGHALNHELVRALRYSREARWRRRRLTGRPVLDVREIQNILPHRYPFLMVDRVIEIEGNRRAVGLKNVTANEAFFQGHYPGLPIMPGVLILDALAQMGGILLGRELDVTGKVAVLLSMDKVKFRRAVRPGDQLILDVQAVRVKTRTGHVYGRATVGDELAAEAHIKFMMADAEPL